MREDVFSSREVQTAGNFKASSSKEGLAKNTLEASPLSWACTSVGSLWGTPSSCGLAADHNLPVCLPTCLRPLSPRTIVASGLFLQH